MNLKFSAKVVQTGSIKAQSGTSVEKVHREDSPKSLEDKKIDIQEGSLDSGMNYNSPVIECKCFIYIFHKILRPCRDFLLSKKLNDLENHTTELDSIIVIMVIYLILRFKLIYYCLFFLNDSKFQLHRWIDSILFAILYHKKFKNPPPAHTLIQ